MSRWLPIIFAVACARVPNHAAVSSRAPTDEMLLLSGTLDDTSLVINPAYFIPVRASPAIEPPADSGALVGEGFDRGGHLLFRRHLSPLRGPDAPSLAAFNIAIRLSATARDSLATIRVTAPNGRLAERSARIGRRELIRRADDDRPLARLQRTDADHVRLAFDSAIVSGVMVRDPDSGEVLAIATRPTVIATSKRTLLLVLSDGVQSVSKIVNVEN